MHDPGDCVLRKASPDRRRDELPEELRRPKSRLARPTSLSWVNWGTSLPEKMGVSRELEVQLREVISRRLERSHPATRVLWAPGGESGSTAL